MPSFVHISSAVLACLRTFTFIILYEFTLSRTMSDLINHNILCNLILRKQTQSKRIKYWNAIRITRARCLEIMIVSSSEIPTWRQENPCCPWEIKRRLNKMASFWKWSLTQAARGIVPKYVWELKIINHLFRNYVFRHSLSSRAVIYVWKNVVRDTDLFD